MKKAFITAFIMFAAAFLLLFSFQKDNNRTNSSGKKINTSLHETIIRKKIPTSHTKQTDKTIESGKESYSTKPEEIISEPEMNETLEAFFKAMPRTDLIAELTSGELHNTPSAVLAAGEILAAVHEYFTNHPQTRDVEMTFYLKCSQQKDFFDSVRAVCAARLSQHYFEATGHQISSEIFDKNIDLLRREINL